MRPSSRSSLFLPVMTLALVAAHDALAWRVQPGLGAALVLAAALAAVLLRWPCALDDLTGRLLALAAIAAALSLAVEPGRLGAALGVALLVALAARGRRRGAAPAWDLAALLGFPAIALRAALADLLKRRSRRVSARTLDLRPWLVPAAIAGTFALVFCAGDILFRRAVRSALAFAVDVLTPEPARWATGLLVALIAWGLLRFRMPRAVARALDALALHRQSEARAATPGLVVRTLVLLHVVFLVENALGLRHAWPGAALPAGVTLASTSHRAAAALLLAALLSAALTLLAFAVDGAAERHRLARALAVLWLGQVAVLLATAVLRLERYVVAYSLTRLRLAAILLFVLVAAGIVLLGARLLLRRDNGWLVRRASLASLAMLLAVAWSDVDGLVARYNVRHCRELGGGASSLDLAYLERLGPSALPAIREARARMSGWWALDAPEARLRARLGLEAEDWRTLSVRQRALRALP